MASNKYMIATGSASEMPKENLKVCTMKKKKKALNIMSTNMYMQKNPIRIPQN